MDQSCSESDVSLSPSRILERLQTLRSLQLMQRGKLQKQRLHYQETPETSSITEIVSHFSNSTSYNTFQSLLQSPVESLKDSTPRLNSSLPRQINERDLVDGVSVLNLSQESEFIANSPISSRSRVSGASITNNEEINKVNNDSNTNSLEKHVSLDEMPILSPKKDFEALILEKLKSEKLSLRENNIKVQIQQQINQTKKPFLRRGEGLARFGLKSKEIVIQNTKALPWHRRSFDSKSASSPVIKKLVQSKKVNVDENTNNKSLEIPNNVDVIKYSKAKSDIKFKPKCLEPEVKITTDNSVNSSCETQNSLYKPMATGKHPLQVNKGKTWAAILTKEQDDFLRQLKQSEYYKNFNSPAKSLVSECSYDENCTKLRQERENAEQNMFDLLENKVSSDNFSIENSFFNRFINRNKLECSGESTPLVMQRCLANNPNLMHIFPELDHKRKNDSQSDAETCGTDCSECATDNNSSVSSCCSCNTVEPIIKSRQSPEHLRCKKDTGQNVNVKKKNRLPEINNKHNDTDDRNDIKADMAEMQAKLVATSELLKERLKELEDEIETFRKENANLTKLREEIDLERQKFYEEKSTFEQKYNEEKILSEYYLSEEKEKLMKQKQMYDRYVREIRGRLNKKDKDEVINLKKEISDLREEIRLKDAKSTSTIARLRNQVKIMEKEKKDLQDEVEKLKKTNRRIQHSNDVTRRLTNLKYLEQINKKLSHMASRDSKSEVSVDNDAKYKSYEIERQGRIKKIKSTDNCQIRRRAKSVPNLNVTSRYAKYFSQRDSVSQLDRSKIEHMDNYSYSSDNDYVGYKHDDILIERDDTESIQEKNIDNNENHLEKIYMERFQSAYKSSTSNLSNTSENSSCSEKYDNDEHRNDFFIQKATSNSIRNSVSPNCNNSSGFNSCSSKSSNFSHKSNKKSLSDKSTSSEFCLKNIGSESTYSRSKSPTSVCSNITSVHKTVVNNVSPEPSTSKSSLTKTSLNPTEIIRPDGTKEFRFPNGNVKYISADAQYSKFVYYNGDVKENFYKEGRIKYFYAETKTYHTTHADGLEVLEFPDGQVEKRYRDGSTEIRLANGSIRYYDPKNEHVREEWRFPDGAAVTVSANGEQRIVFSNGQVEVRAKDHKRREFPDGTVKLVYNDGTSETRYATGRVRIKDNRGNLIMDSAPG